MELRKDKIMVTKKKRVTVINRGFIVIFFILAWLMVFFTQAWAETMNFKIVCHVVKNKRIQVGDREGHFMGVFLLNGLVFFENGEVATYQGWETYDMDFTKKKSSAQGYGQYRYLDGLAIVIKYQGTGTAAQDDTIWSYKGAGEYVQGMGCFEGIKGNLSYTGKGFPPYSEEMETGGNLYFEVTAGYTLPSQ
jgi:hypothetical protein